MAEGQTQVVRDALYGFRVNVHSEDVGEGFALGSLGEFQVGRFALEGQLAVDGHVTRPLVLASVSDQVNVDVTGKDQSRCF